jgi:dihydroxyacetone kinase-like protein
MVRGFQAVQKALAGQDGSVPPGQLLTIAGKTLVSTVGGASGPLYGTALRRAGRALGKDPEFDGAALAGALEAAVDGVRELGAAAPGDKTMVDALMPALDALREALDTGDSLESALSAAADAAEEGARATMPMQARKGRASYLGERSIGHQDPGATSSALILRALERVVARGG